VSEYEWFMQKTGHTVQRRQGFRDTVYLLVGRIMGHESLSGMNEKSQQTVFGCHGIGLPEQKMANLMGCDNLGSNPGTRSGCSIW
jgi:hypothetical protein